MEMPGLPLRRRYYLGVVARETVVYFAATGIRREVSNGNLNDAGDSAALLSSELGSFISDDLAMIACT